MGIESRLRSYKDFVDEDLYFLRKPKLLTGLEFIRSFEGKMMGKARAFYHGTEIVSPPYPEIASDRYGRSGNISYTALRVALIFYYELDLAPTDSERFSMTLHGHVKDVKEAVRILALPRFGLKFYK